MCLEAFDNAPLLCQACRAAGPLESSLIPGSPRGICQRNTASNQEAAQVHTAQPMKHAMDGVLWQILCPYRDVTYRDMWDL